MGGLVAFQAYGRTGELLVRTALWGALGGSLSGWAVERARGWRTTVDCALVGGLGLPAALAIGGALVPFFSSWLLPRVLSHAAPYAFRYVLAIAGAAGGALAGGALGGVMGYYEKRRKGP